MGSEERGGEGRGGAGEEAMPAMSFMMPEGVSQCTQVMSLGRNARA